MCGGVNKERKVGKKYGIKEQKCGKRPVVERRRKGNKRGKKRESKLGAHVCISLALFTDITEFFEKSADLEHKYHLHLQLPDYLTIHM